tara:strand:- start:142 stop:600 length:459 start_codon:yes stop_codon:yes gene_type:complete
MYYNFTEMPTMALLQKFANQRPQLDYCNYGDPKSYRQEMREITKDLHDFRELLNFAVNRVNDIEGTLKAYLLKNSGRLTLNEKGELNYITGQYFPTEYRPCCNRILASLIWSSYRDEKRWNELETPVYEDGNAIRHAIKRNVSRRVAKFYFN